MSDTRPEPVSDATAEELLPVRIDVLRVLEIGTVCWILGLIITLVVPALHGDGRGWWPWTCVAGIVGGVTGWSYVRRGRGNAAAA